MAGRHDAECATFRRVTQERGEGERLPTPVRGAAHVLARFGEEGVRERVRGMVGWRDKQLGGGKGVELQAKAVVHYLGMEMSRRRLEDALELLCVVSLLGRSLEGVWGRWVTDSEQMNVNSFRITDASGDEIGIGFDPLLGMANHSCAPNASLEFDGRCAVLTALKHIEEGEEITISYIGQSSLPRLPTCLTQTSLPSAEKLKLTIHQDTNQPRAVRQAFLQEHYYFTCACPACTTSSTPPTAVKPGS